MKPQELLSPHKRSNKGQLGPQTNQMIGLSPLSNLTKKKVLHPLRPPRRRKKISKIKRVAEIVLLKAAEQVEYRL